MTLLVVALVVTVVVWVFTRRQVVSTDEAWQLVVADRVLHRLDVLYRDVFFGAGPLSVWLLAAAIPIGGVEVRTLRALNALVTGVMAAALWSLADSMHLPDWMAVALVALTALGCGPVADLESLYSNLSRAGLLVAAAGLLHGSPWSIALAGAGVGVALMSKYTVGLVGTLLLVPLAIALRVDGWSLVAAAGACTVVVALGLAPLAIHERGIRSMIWRLGPGKRSFLEHGRLGLWHSLRRERPYFVLLAAIVPFAVASLPVAYLAWRDGAPGRDPLLVLWALGTWWACTWPRCDTAHVRSGLPFAAVAVCVALESAGNVWSATWVDVVMVAFAGWTAWTVLLGMAHARRHGSRGPGGRVQGCRGAQWPLSDEHVEWLAIASRIAGGRALVLGRHAPIAYLVSGIHDPTPFDYPLASTFGPHGQQQVVDALDAGRIHHVVEIHPLPDEMAPTLIDDWVRANTEEIWQMGHITLRRPVSRQR